MGRSLQIVRPAPARPIEPGDLVMIEGKAGKVDQAEVIEVCDATDLTAVRPFVPPEIDLDRSAEGFRCAAVIAYEYYLKPNRPLPVYFVAFQDFNGVWWDRQGHPLTIVKAGN